MPSMPIPPRAVLVAVFGIQQGPIPLVVVSSMMMIVLIVVVVGLGH